MENYSFARLSLSNLHHLVYLYKQCFKLRVDLEYLKQKYNTIPFGAAYVGFLATENGSERPAAYYGVFPILCRKDGVDYLAAQSGDTMTHPKHQGKGLFVRLAKMTYELAKSEGIHFVFGFPNKNSYPGFINKLEWKHYADINNYRIKASIIPFDKLAKKFLIFGFFYKHFIKMRLKKKLTERFIENSIEYQNSKLGFIPHNKIFYQYKAYFNSYRINLDGICCVIKVDGRLWVGDVEFIDRENYKRTINDLRKLGKKLGCSSIQFSVFEGTHADEILKEKNGIHSKSPVGAVNLSREVETEEFAYQALDFDTF